MARAPKNHDAQSPEVVPFNPSPESSVGVELELQIIDPESGDLVPGAQRILDTCAEEGLEGVDGEFLLSMLEIKTGVCHGIAEVRDQLFPLLRKVRTIASSLGFHLAVAGAHPFSRPCSSAISPAERYQRIRKRQGWLAYHETIFGLHVHVGVPSGNEAIGLINDLVEYLPHLLALSANSPFWQGVDTGFASSRAVMFRPSPQSGVPQHFTSWDGFCRYYRVMHDGGALDTMKDIYWDLRPRPDLGTIEFRVCDAPASPAALLGLAALARNLVVDGLRRLRERPALGRGDQRRFWLAAENKWLAARYGLEAVCARRPRYKRIALADDTERLLLRLIPVASLSREDGFLRSLLPSEGYESGADHQRGIYRQSGDWRAVVEDLKNRWSREPEGTAAPVNLGVVPSPRVPEVPEGLPPVRNGVLPYRVG